MIVNCLVKQFVICLGVVVILLGNIMEVLLWMEVLCWIDRVWSSKQCACCASDPIVHLSVPFIDFVYVCFFNGRICFIKENSTKKDIKTLMNIRLNIPKRIQKYVHADILTS